MITLILPADGDINWFDLIIGALEDIETYLNSLTASNHEHVMGETPTGGEEPDGVIDTWTLADPAIPGSLAVTYNGYIRIPAALITENLDVDGMVESWTATGWTNLPQTGESLLWDYAKVVTI